MLMSNPWNASTLSRRIATDGARKVRHAAGSPCPDEVQAYARGLPEGLEAGSALVLGMTPELRNLAAQRAAHTVAIDRNHEAIALYRDWLEPDLLERERIVESGWFELDTQVIPEAPFLAILGDGIFGNTSDRAAHLQLLGLLRTLLAPGGRMVFRKALSQVDQPHADAAALIRQFRAGEIDEADFGMGMRLTGFLASTYDRDTSILDNGSTFAAIEAMVEAGELTKAEHAIILRYYFGGTNCLLTRDDWESVLREAAMAFRVHSLSGKLWYGYYPVYEVWPTH